MMFILLPACLIPFYLIFRLLLPSKLTQLQKTVLSCLVGIGSGQFLFDSLVSGGLNSEHLPSFVVATQAWILFTLILLFCFTLARDCFFLYSWLHVYIKKIVFILRKSYSTHDQKEKEPSTQAHFSPQRRAFMLTLAAAIPAAYAVREATTVPKVKNMRVKISNLPKAFEGLRLVHLTDLHISPLFTESWARCVVEQVNALQPDLVLFSGDMVDGLPSQRGSNIEPLSLIKSKYGVFGCVGNHEYYSDYAAWVERFSHLGIVMLENSHKMLTINGETIAIAGVTDIAAKRFSLPMPDPYRALEGVPHEVTSIMLDHRPGNAKNNAKAGASLQLSGHTHGGQIIGMDLVVRRLNNGYVRGWYTVSGMPMYVSSGAGLWHGFPVRLGIPSELPCITLHCA